MSFYGGRGDFYRGTGDPGLFDFIGKAIGKVASFIPGVGPAVQVATSVGGAIVGHARSRAIAARESAAQRGVTTGLVHKQWGPAVGTAIETTGRIRRIKGVKQMMPGPGGTMVPFHGFKRRHMNVANVKALHRAVRRLLGFKHLANKIEKSLMTLARRHHYRPPAAAAPFRRRNGRGRGDMMLGDFYQGDG